MKRIFLGLAGKVDWRPGFIMQLDDRYEVMDLKTCHMNLASALEMKVMCDYNVHFITPFLTETELTLEIADLIQDAYKYPQKTLFAFGAVVGGDYPGDRFALDQVGRMVADRGAIWSFDMNGMVDAINRGIKGQIVTTEVECERVSDNAAGR